MSINARNSFLLVLPFSVFTVIVLRWLWSDAFLAEFNSDTADSLFWATAAREAGAIASPTFHYNYFIPFGDGILLRPLLSVCKSGVTAMRISMTVFLAAFSAASFALFRSMKWSRSACWLSVALVLTVASSTPKMREIYFGHALFYSLGTLFLFLSLSIAPDPAGSASASRQTRIVRGSLFALCMAWASSCGKPLLLYVVVPVFGAWFFVRSADPRPWSKDRDEATLLPGVLGACAGLALFHFLSRDILPIEYAAFYERFASPFEWWDHVEKLAAQWIELVCPFGPVSVPIASIDGFPLAGQIALAILFAFAPVLGLVRIRMFSQREKMLLAGHWILAAEVLFYWTFGTVSDANWRLCPVVLSATAATACVIRNLLCAENVFGRRMAVVAAASVAIVCLMVNLRTVRLSGDRSAWRTPGSLLPLLESTGIADGYCTDYWFANAITVLSGNRFRLREVERAGKGKWKGRPYLTDDRWFEPDPTKTKTVFVCRLDEEYRAPKQGLVSRAECRQFDTRNGRLAELVVLAYDGDCLHPAEDEASIHP